MNRERVKELSIALVIVGITLSGVSLLFPTAIASGLATVGVDTTAPDLYSMNPYSSDSSSPDQLAIGEEITVYAWIYDGGSGVDDAWVNINGTKYTLSSTGETKQYDIGEYAYKYAMSWTPPSSDTLYTFKFHATDKAGNEGVTTTYGKTTPKPSGKLFVNGKDVTGKGTVWFKTTDFTFKTKVTQGASIVTSVSLMIDGSSNSMSRVSGTDTWKYSQTLSEGTHSVKTVINWATGSVSVQGIDINVGGEGREMPMSNESIIGLIMGISIVAVGAVLGSKPGLVSE